MAGPHKPRTIKHPKIYEDDSGIVYLEFSEEYECCFVHVDINKYQHKHYKKVLGAILEVVKYLGLPALYAYTDNPKVKRIAKLHGFTPTGKAVLGDDGVYREVFELCQLK